MHYIYKKNNEYNNLFNKNTVKIHNVGKYKINNLCTCYYKCLHTEPNAMWLLLLHLTGQSNPGLDYD